MNDYVYFQTNVSFGFTTSTRSSLNVYLFKWPKHISGSYWSAKPHIITKNAGRIIKWVKESLQQTRFTKSVPKANNTIKIFDVGSLADALNK
jgi:hypothetical protein